MKVKIKFIKAAGGNNVGDELEVTRGAAKHLIGIEYAEEVKPTRRGAKPDSED